MATVNIVKRTREKGLRYQVYYKDPYSGKKKYYKTFPKQRDAQQAANDLRTLLDSGKLPDRNKSKMHMMTFGDVAEELVNEWNSKRQTGELRNKTVDEYIYTLNIVKKEFGHLLLGEINEDHIKSYRARVAVELSNISSNKRFAVIQKIFAKGLALNAVIENPTKGIKKLSEKDHERNRFLSPKEIYALVEASKLTKAKNYLPVLIFLGCEHGGSKQEALSLKWTDIDFDFKNIGMIRFYRTMILPVLEGHSVKRVYSLTEVFDDNENKIKQDQTAAFTAVQDRITCPCRKGWGSDSSQAIRAS